MGGSGKAGRYLASLLLALTIGLVAIRQAQASPLVPTGGEAVSDSNLGLIIGLIVGAVAVVGGLVFLILFFKRRKQDEEDTPPAAPAEGRPES